MESFAKSADQVAEVRRRRKHAKDFKLKPFRVALTGRERRLIPLLCEQDFSERMTRERHVCIDTIAVGGNASLLAQC